MSLDEIGRKHGTDKASHFHDYLRYYEKFIDFQPRHILEIGVYEGASLAMWQEHYNCVVYGVDIRPCPQLENDKIHVRIGDQRDARFLKQVCQEIVPEQFDLIIDDGSHQAVDTLITFSILFHLLKPGGIYICEDTCCSYWPEFNDVVSTPIEFFKQTIDAVHLHGFRPKDEDGKWVNQRSREILSKYTNVPLPNVEYMIFINGAVLLKKENHELLRS